ncbi:FAD binding domain-containing protein [Falsiroseomonas ponticola]|uniref:FAD binding domain-containing protein n=1 Tax=Falsiroseomonas ponticola TaxID=2786951 RepID=UPI001931CD28|nr:xanthine dehydrogenase family protein subunit M [Roseomonas ponticola]
MKPPPFAYHDPATLEEAITLLATLPNARPLAGGQSMMPMLNMRFAQPDHLVDLNRIAGLDGVTVEADGALTIGAMARQRVLEQHPEVARRCPLMVEALAQVGHRQTRNRGTIGGSLCHLDPAAELPLVAAAMEAVVRVAGPNGQRDIAFADFAQGYMTPGMEAEELLVAVRIPAQLAGAGHCFLEYARRHGDFAIASVAVMLVPDAAGRIAEARVALGGVGAVPLRLPEAEAALRGTPDITRAVAATRSLEPMEDALVPAWYRRHLAGVLLGRAIATALSRMGRA